MLTIAPPRPNSAFIEFSSTRNSWMESGGGWITTVPLPNSLLSSPSRRKLLSNIRRPFTDKEMPGRLLSVDPAPALVPVAPWFAPGPRYASLKKFLPFKGRSTMRFSSSIVPKEEVSVSSSGAAPVTSTVWVTPPTLQRNVQPDDLSDADLDVGLDRLLKTFFLEACLVSANLQVRGAVGSLSVGGHCDRRSRLQPP